jgi:hypothetical protein
MPRNSPSQNGYLTLSCPIAQSRCVEAYIILDEYND